MQKKIQAGICVLADVTEWETAENTAALSGITEQMWPSVTI